MTSLLWVVYSLCYVLEPQNILQSMMNMFLFPTSSLGSFTSDLVRQVKSNYFLTDIQAQPSKSF